MIVGSGGGGLGVWQICHGAVCCSRALRSTAGGMVLNGPHVQSPCH